MPLSSLFRAPLRQAALTSNALRLMTKWSEVMDKVARATSVTEPTGAGTSCARLALLPAPHHTDTTAIHGN
jgi:hypothetical protein